MVIQVVLIAVFLLLLLRIFQQRALGPVFRAVTVVLIGLASYVVIDPNAANRVAAFAGVGRGADLIIYICMAVGAYLLTVLYVRLKETDLRVARLVQRLAIEKHRVEELTAQVHARREN
ncbi:MAG: DUF2304 family protein [Terriglobia bacterium]